MKEIESRTDGSEMRIAIVVSRFNEFVTKSLLEGALSALKRCGVHEENITVAWVPGAFELPVVAKRFAMQADIDAVVCLGAVIYGKTEHFTYVCQGATSGILQAGLDTDKAVSFGVLTCNSVEEAIERCGVKHTNKGAEAALTAIETASVLSQVPTPTFAAS